MYGYLPNVGAVPVPTQAKALTTGSATPFGCSQENVTRPFGPSGSFDRLVLLGREADLHDDGAALIVGERRTSGARVHGYRIQGHRKFRKRVDTVTYAGHNKNMTTTQRPKPAEQRKKGYLDARNDARKDMYNPRHNWKAYREGYAQGHYDHHQQNPLQAV